MNTSRTEIYEKVDDSRSSKSNTVRFYHRGWSINAISDSGIEVIHPMKLYKMASACLALGLLTPVVSAEEKPQRAERRNSEAKPGGPAAKDPAEMVAKMLSEFDSDGDSLLNTRELTAMFTAIRQRSLQARAGQSGQGQSGQSRQGQGRAGQGRPNTGRRGPGARNAKNGQNQPPDGRAIQANVEGVAPANSKQQLREKADKRRKRPVPGQTDGSEQKQRPGGARPERPAAE